MAGGIKILWVMQRFSLPLNTNIDALSDIEIVRLFRILYAGFAGLNEFSELSAPSHSPKMFAINICIQDPIEPEVNAFRVGIQRLKSAPADNLDLSTSGAQPSAVFAWVACAKGVAWRYDLPTLVDWTLPKLTAVPR